MMITAKTKITGLFGYPVEHSISPAMHNAGFAALGIDYCYLGFLVAPQALASAVQGIKAMNFKGVNVTIPHKENVIPLLDEVNEEARFIGAVNTVLNRDGVLAGYNTDGRGFMKSLEEAGVDPAGKKVLIVGAGGASRAIGYYLAQKAERLTLFDIDREKLGKLAEDLNKVSSHAEAAESLSGMEEADIIINATPLGLKPGDPLPVDIAKVQKKQVVCDLIYKNTPLLQGASATKGCTTVNGLGMLFWQGVLAFEIWTGTTAPVETMKKALAEAFEKQK